MSSPLKIKLTLSLLILFMPAAAFCYEISTPAYNAGKSIYEKYCKVCHGDNGDGKTFVRNALKTPPANFTEEDAAKRLSLSRMKKSVLFGRSGTAMVSWKRELSNENIDNVLLFIRSGFMKINDEANEIPEKSYEEVITNYSGVFNEGMKLYNKHCYHCHGKKGDARMPVNNGLKSRPRNFTDPLVKETLLPVQMFYSIRDGINGTAMVSWKREFSDKEIIDIIKYIQSGLMEQRAPRPGQ